jgi:hypothetical protein
MMSPALPHARTVRRTSTPIPGRGMPPTLRGNHALAARFRALPCRFPPRSLRAENISKEK